MFLFQASANAKVSNTAAGSKTLSAQEFSKKVDQLYVRTEVSFREVQRSIGALDIGDRILSRNWLEIFAGGTPAGAIPTKKEMDLYASAGIYQVAFKDFQGKYNALKGAIGSKDETKVQPALSALAKSYFELAVSQARLVQKLEEYDLRGFEYVMPALEKVMDVGMVVGLATGVGAVASLGRAALAATLKQFLAKSTGKAFASAFAGSALFTALNFGTEYYSFGQLSGAMKRMNTDQAGALGELAGILKSTKKKAGEDGAQFDRLILNVDVARAELVQRLKSDPSYKLDAGRVAAYFGETFAQLVVFEMGFGFFRAAGKAAMPKAKAQEAALARAGQERAAAPRQQEAMPTQRQQNEQFVDVNRRLSATDMPLELSRVLMDEGMKDFEIPKGRLDEFAIFARNYADRYPDIAAKGERSDPGLSGLLESYGTWKAKEGGSMVDFMQVLERTGLPHELACRSGELQLLLYQEFGAEYLMGTKAIRLKGTARVYELSCKDGRQFIAKVDDVSREMFAHGVLRLLGTDAGYKIAKNGDLGVMELVDGMTFYNFANAGGMPSAVQLRQILPGAAGPERANFLSSLSRIMAQQFATYMDDSHAGNFIVKRDGSLVRIDFNEFGIKKAGPHILSPETLPKMDEKLAGTIGRLTPDELALMEGEFKAEWKRLQQGFGENSGQLRQAYSGFRSSGVLEQTYTEFETNVARTPDRAWNDFLGGAQK